MIEQSDWLANIGALLADRSRSAMLMRLMDGRAYTATELAHAANIASPTASHHLERLETAGLIARIRQGRHSYFRIAGEDVAGLVERALGAHAALNVAAVETSCPLRLRQARFCYNHLAGELGVRLLVAGLERKIFETAGDGVQLQESGAPLLAALDRDFGQISREQRQGRFCLDWSERRFHLAGPLATLLTKAMLANRWLLAGRERELMPTEKGRRQFRHWFGI